MTKLIILTASIDPEKTKQYWSSWRETLETYRVYSHFVIGQFGVVPAFWRGLNDLRNNMMGIDDSIVCLFHDDLKIYQKGWDRYVLDFFEHNENVGLCGFGGATGLGDINIYKKYDCECCEGLGIHPYDTEDDRCSECDNGKVEKYKPHQLARVDFHSNMKEAEAHGRRISTPEEAVCFDGFSQIGRFSNIYKWMEEIYNLGIRHHFYDSMLGALSKRDGFNNWTLPVSCHHAGGVTAVGSEDYQRWALEQSAKGDQGFWEEAHKLGYEYLRGVLPLRV